MLVDRYKAAISIGDIVYQYKDNNCEYMRVVVIGYWEESLASTSLREIVASLGQVSRAGPLIESGRTPWNRSSLGSHISGEVMSISKHGRISSVGVVELTAEASGMRTFVVYFQNKLSN